MNYLSSYQQAALVISAINILPHRDDLIASMNGTSSLYHFGCCPVCCLPCSVLKELLDAGDLDDLLREAPRELGVRRYDWWDRELEGLDRNWPKAWWTLFPCPNHE